MVGGVLKGALGMGAPLLAVPVLALFFSVPFAVCMFVMPNLVSNAQQLFQYRSSIPKGPLAWLFAAGGGLGALIGSFALDGLPTDFLKLTFWPACSSQRWPLPHKAERCWPGPSAHLQASFKARRGSQHRSA
ncbi:sulfite exporter TauE/SafE family protein [Alphaproteobacteria bacterium]|nr:sulfite exporter TauE/SafE family protein [Alphaproteobacteria bacterium]